MKQPWLAFCAIVLVVGLSLAGCATANKIQGTRATLDKAKAAGAMQKAPFEYAAADAYLKKADHQLKKGDTKAAESFRKQADAYAVKALEMSGGGAK